MNILTDALHVNKDALKDTLPKLRHAPLLAAAYVLYQIVLYLVNMIGVRLGSGIGFLWGFIVYLVNIAITAHFLTLLLNVIRYDRLKIQDMQDRNFMRLFAPLMQAFFVLYLIELVFGMFANPLLPGFVSSLLLLLWAGAKTPVNESIYLGNRFGYDALRHTLDFWRDNWAQWAVPVLAAFIFKLFIEPRIYVLTSISLWMLPVIWFITGSFIAAWMIWRGELFLTLNNSSLRSRAYRRSNNY